MIETNKIIILANGSFPESAYCRELLDKANTVICCDEAADHLLNYGKTPDLIIGDMDSISPETKSRFRDLIIELNEQENNDLTKAVNYCIDQGYTSVTILGATGLREDHTLGNISLLLEYNKKIRAIMVTDYGTFSMMNSGESITSFPGERISFFSIDNQVRVCSKGLKFPLEDLQLHNWWRATLNEATGKSFSLDFESEWPFILFRARS